MMEIAIQEILSVPAHINELSDIIAVDGGVRLHNLFRSADPGHSLE
jgi:hypothetical protein